MAYDLFSSLVSLCLLASLSPGRKHIPSNSPTHPVTTTTNTTDTRAQKQCLFNKCKFTVTTIIKNHSFIKFRVIRYAGVNMFYFSILCECATIARKNNTPDFLTAIFHNIHVTFALQRILIFSHKKSEEQTKGEKELNEWNWFLASLGFVQSSQLCAQ